MGCTTYVLRTPDMGCTTCCGPLTWDVQHGADPWHGTVRGSGPLVGRFLSELAGRCLWGGGGGAVKKEVCKVWGAESRLTGMKHQPTLHPLPHLPLPFPPYPPPLSFTLPLPLTFLVCPLSHTLTPAPSLGCILSLFPLSLSLSQPVPIPFPIHPHSPSFSSVFVDYFFPFLFSLFLSDILWKKERERTVTMLSTAIHFF